MRDLLILIDLLLIPSGARLAQVQPLMRHLLLFLCLSDWHAVVSARKVTVGRHFHVTIHAQIVVVLLVIKHRRGATAQRGSGYFIFIGSCSRLTIGTHMSVRGVGIVHA